MAYTPSKEEIEKITNFPDTVEYWRTFADDFHRDEYEAFCSSHIPTLAPEDDESLAYYYYDNRNDPTKNAEFEKKVNAFDALYHSEEHPLPKHFEKVAAISASRGTGRNVFNTGLILSEIEKSAYKKFLTDNHFEDLSSAAAYFASQRQAEKDPMVNLVSSILSTMSCETQLRDEFAEVSGKSFEKWQLFTQLHEDQYRAFLSAYKLEDKDISNPTFVSLFCLSQKYSTNEAVRNNFVEEITRFEAYVGGLARGINQTMVRNITENPTVVQHWALYRQTHPTAYQQFLDRTGFQDGKVAVAAFVYDHQESKDVAKKKDFVESNNKLTLYETEYGKAKAIPTPEDLEPLRQNLATWSLYTHINGGDYFAFADKYGFEPELDGQPNPEIVVRFVHSNETLKPVGYLDSGKLDSEGLPIRDGKKSIFEHYLEQAIPSDVIIEEINNSADLQYTMKLYRHFEENEQVFQTFIKENGLTALDEQEKIARFLFSRTHSPMLDKNMPEAQRNRINKQSLENKAAFADALNAISAKAYVFQPFQDAIDSIVNPGSPDVKAQNLADLNAYVKHFAKDYELFCLLQKIEGPDVDKPESMARFIYAEKFDPQGNVKPGREEGKSYYEERCAEVLAEINAGLTGEVSYEDSLKKAGTRTGSAIIEQDIPVMGATVKAASQTIKLKNAEPLDLKGDQTVSVISDPNVLIAITQQDAATKAVTQIAAITKNPDGTYALNMDAKYFDTLVAGNPALLNLVEDQRTAGATTYSIPVAGVKLSQDLNIEGLQIVGTDKTNYSVMFSALGCQISDASGKKHIDRNQSKMPFDIAISTEFLSKSLQNIEDGISDNGCMIGDNLFNPDNPNKNPAFANLMMCALALNPGGVTLGKGNSQIKLSTYALDKSGMPLNVMQIGTPPTARTFVYMHLKETSTGAKPHAPQFYEVKYASLQKGKGEYQLSIGIGDAKHVHLVFDEKDPKNIATIRALNGDAKNPGPFGAAFEMTPAGSTEVKPLARDKIGISTGVRVYNATKEQSLMMINQNISDLQKLVVEKKGEKPPERKNFLDPQLQKAKKASQIKKKEWINGKTLVLGLLFVMLSVFLPFFALLAGPTIALWMAKQAGIIYNKDNIRKAESTLSAEELANIKLEMAAERKRNKVITEMNIHGKKSLQNEIAANRKKLKNLEDEKKILEEKIAKTPSGKKAKKLQNKLNRINRSITQTETILNGGKLDDGTETKGLVKDLEDFELAERSGAEPMTEAVQRALADIDQNESLNRGKLAETMMRDAVNTALINGQITADQVESFIKEWTQRNSKLFNRSGNKGKGSAAKGSDGGKS